MLLKLGGSVVVNKDSQTIHLCSDTMKAFINLGFNKGYRTGVCFV